MHEAILQRIEGIHQVNAPGELPPSDDSALAAEPGLRVPPKSIEAEQSVLGGLLLDASALGQLAGVLVTGDFYAYSHQLIFDAVRTMADSGDPVDVVTLWERLKSDGNDAAVGGLPYLTQLAQSVPSVANLRRHAEIVAERATRRAIIARADEMAAAAFKGEQPTVDLLEDAKAAIAQLQEGRQAGAGGVPLLTLGELRERSHSVSWLVKNVIPADSIGMVFGASQTFKSFVALDAALHVAHGLPWLGRRTKQGAVVYIAAEGGTGLWKRICAWHRARRLQWDKTPMLVVPVAVDLAVDAQRIVDQVKASGAEPALVVIDTLSQTYAGEENSANEVAAYFRAIGARMRQTWGCAVMVLHHSGHSATDRPRGSTAMAANVDWMFGVHRDEKEMIATLSCVKQKDGERFADSNFSLAPIQLGTDLDGDEVKSLVARHIASADDLREAMDGEAKAGRGGHKHALLKLIQNGSLESEVRTAFMAECQSDNPETRRKAYHRAKQELIQGGLIDVAQGRIVTLFKDSG